MEKTRIHYSDRAGTAFFLELIDQALPLSDFLLGELASRIDSIKCRWQIPASRFNKALI